MSKMGAAAQNSGAAQIEHYNLGAAAHASGAARRRAQKA